MRVAHLAVALTLLAPAAALAAPPGPGPQVHNGCRSGEIYHQFANREQFGSWALFNVYQQQMNCQPVYVFQRWCQFKFAKTPSGKPIGTKVSNCQVRPPAAALTAAKKGA